MLSRLWAATVVPGNGLPHGQKHFQRCLPAWDSGNLALLAAFCTLGAFLLAVCLPCLLLHLWLPSMRSFFSESFGSELPGFWPPASLAIRIQDPWMGQHIVIHSESIKPLHTHSHVAMSTSCNSTPLIWASGTNPFTENHHQSNSHFQCFFHNGILCLEGNRVNLVEALTEQPAKDESLSRPARQTRQSCS